MELKSIIAKLHPLERAVLPVLQSATTLPEIVSGSKLQEIEVMRALQWLENKGVLKIHTDAQKVVTLGKNGERYKNEGLPEKRLLEVLTEEWKGLNVITKKSGLSREEVTAAVGILRKKGALEMQKGDPYLLVREGHAAKAMRGKAFPEEEFLKKEFPLRLDALAGADKIAFDELKRRKEFIEVRELKSVSVELTDAGRQLAAMKLEQNVVNRLTTEMLRTGTWKDKVIRAYDVEVNVPRRTLGRKHFVTDATQYARQIWLEMGFQEMSGNMVQTSFWNFDALFTAQDHPVRELQDTFYVGGKEEYGSLPSKELVKKVKAVHETGGNTRSAGWRYQWNEEEAKKNVLRTHTTVLSAQTLAALRESGKGGKGIKQGKFFALGKCFRNEALDWSHLFEFNQTEGIVVDRKANFRHLLGYLKEFFAKMGFEKIRIRPGFFPYVEPGLEIDVYHPIKERWVELGGAGIFRPEVVVPLLGEDIPVLAWGPGFDRIILDYYKIGDIRELYKNDIKQLREMKVWLK